MCMLYTVRGTQIFIQTLPGSELEIELVANHSNIFIF